MIKFNMLEVALRKRLST